MLSQLRHLVRSTDGPTAVEYAILIGLICLVSIAGVKTVANQTGATFTSAGGVLGNSTHQSDK